MGIKFCISVVLDSNYEKYILYFIYFIKKTHPKAYIKIFVIGEISDKIKYFINEIDTEKKCTLVENFFNDFPKGNQEIKSIRWIIPKKYFKEFDYVYIGDIDMLICKEDETILEQHKNHCILNNISYSNTIRGEQKRFTGLHFFNVDKYYNNIGKIIEKKYVDIKNGEIILSETYRNEHLLYDIINESNIGFPKKENEISVDDAGPHHGLHLGLWRRWRYT
jgi:hypothetical protein